MEQSVLANPFEQALAHLMASTWHGKRSRRRTRFVHAGNAVHVIIGFDLTAEFLDLLADRDNGAGKFDHAEADRQGNPFLAKDGHPAFTEKGGVASFIQETVDLLKRWLWLVTHGVVYSGQYEGASSLGTIEQPAAPAYWARGFWAVENSAPRLGMANKRPRAEIAVLQGPNPPVHFC
jgi:hypothetical protein